MLKVVGAGLPRTGTMSLKHALERLLGGSCYHMIELLEHPEHAAMWADAFEGGATDWESVVGGYRAAVDWPASRVWRDLAAAYPDALVLLSVRESGEQWWRSVNQTVFAKIREARDFAAAGPPPDHAGAPAAGAVGGPLAAAAPPEQREAMGRMFQRMMSMDDLVQVVDDETAAVAWYDRHVAAVRAEVPASRLLEWKASDGWAPLCKALGVPIPNEPFPRLNSTEEFLERAQPPAEPAADAAQAG